MTMMTIIMMTVVMVMASDNDDDDDYDDDDDDDGNDGDDDDQVARACREQGCTVGKILSLSFYQYGQCGVVIVAVAC